MLAPSPLPCASSLPFLHLPLPPHLPPSAPLPHADPDATGSPPSSQRLAEQALEDEVGSLKEGKRAGSSPGGAGEAAAAPDVGKGANAPGTAPVVGGVGAMYAPSDAESMEGETYGVDEDVPEWLRVRACVRVWVWVRMCGCVCTWVLRVRVCACMGGGDQGRGGHLLSYTATLLLLFGRQHPCQSLAWCPRTFPHDS